MSDDGWPGLVIVVYCATKYAARAITEGLRIGSEAWLRVTAPGVSREPELADPVPAKEPLVGACGCRYAS